MIRHLSVSMHSSRTKKITNILHAGKFFPLPFVVHLCHDSLNVTVLNIFIKKTDYDEMYMHD